MRTTVLFDANNMAVRILAASPSYDAVMRSPSQKNLIIETFLSKFIKKIRYIERTVKIDNIILVWDSSINKRKLLYPTYKGNRYAKTNIDIENKINCGSLLTLLKTSLRRLGGWSVVEQEGYEADDLIAYIINTGDYQENFIIVSNDADFYQLLSKRVLIMKSDNEYYSDLAFTKEFGIVPHKWIQVKALAGDKSDNISGIEGIGIKKAIKLLRENKCWSYWVEKYTSYDLDIFLELIRLPFDAKNINISIPQCYFDCKELINLFQEFNLSRFTIQDFKGILDK